jgi:hypothetical protein
MLLPLQSRGQSSLLYHRTVGQRFNRALPHVGVCAVILAWPAVWSLRPLASGYILVRAPIRWLLRTFVRGPPTSTLPCRNITSMPFEWTKVSQVESPTPKGLDVSIPLVTPEARPQHSSRWTSTRSRNRSRPGPAPVGTAIRCLNRRSLRVGAAIPHQRRCCLPFRWAPEQGRLWCPSEDLMRAAGQVRRASCSRPCAPSSPAWTMLGTASCSASSWFSKILYQVPHSSVSEIRWLAY